MPFPLSHEEIKKTEIKTGYRFPLGFKAKMASDKGGELNVADESWWLIPFSDSSDRKRIARTCNDIIRETNKMREGRGFPAEAFAVAQNGGGDYLIYYPLPLRMDRTNWERASIAGTTKPEKLKS